MNELGKEPTREEILAVLEPFARIGYELTGEANTDYGPPKSKHYVAAAALHARLSQPVAESAEPGPNDISLDINQHLWDTLAKNRWGVWFNNRAGAWTVQADRQVVGSLGKGPTPQEAIRAAMRKEPAAESAEPGPSDTHCTVPPPGWACTREVGHDGPCAAVRKGRP